MTSITDKLTHDDVDNIVRLAETLHKSNLHFIRIEADGIVIEISKDGAATGVSGRAGAHQASGAAEGQPILSGNVGIFRAAVLESGQAVQAESRVDAGSAVGFVHTLDDINAVNTGVAGQIIEVLARDGDFVEYGQPLFRIAPANVAAS